MPGQPLSFTGHLAQEMGPPAHNIWSEQIFDAVKDPLIGHQVMHCLSVKVAGMDGVTAVADLLCSGNQEIKFLAVGRGLFGGKYVNWREIAGLVVFFDLRSGQRFRIPRFGGEKGESSIEIRQGVGNWRHGEGK